MITIKEAEQGNVYEDCRVVEFNKKNGFVTMTETKRKVIKEVSLKIYVNEQELIPVICLNRQYKELALGLLYNEGVIHSMDDIKSIEYGEKPTAVRILLREGLEPDRHETPGNITSEFGKSQMFLNPFKKNPSNTIADERTYSAGALLEEMDAFVSMSEIYNSVGGTHSVKFCSGDYALLIDDISRHNCFDKLTGILLEENKLDLAVGGILYVSGRLTSEMLMKMMRLGLSVAISKSSPTSAALKLAREFHITILGYVKGDNGIIYSCPERIIP